MRQHGRKIIAGLLIAYSLSGCSVFVKPKKITQESTDEASAYYGWSYVAEKLISDGIAPTLVASVYDGKTVPEKEFVPFKLQPKESAQMYQNQRTRQNVIRARNCFDKYKTNFSKAGKLFDVDPYLLASIMTVETGCGEKTGKHLVVERLSRVSSVKDIANLKKNLRELQKDDSKVTLKEVEARADYLEQTFYPELLELFKLHQSEQLNLLKLRGSLSGAFGFPQFLPTSYVKYGVDGDRDGKISLFEPADAIQSMANYFKQNGWRDEAPKEKKRSAIWKYNKSDAYIDTAFYLIDELKKLDKKVAVKNKKKVKKKEPVIRLKSYTPPSSRDE